MILYTRVAVRQSTFCMSYFSAVQSVRLNLVLENLHWLLVEIRDFFSVGFSISLGLADVI